VIIAVDIGNSAAKAALVEGDDVHAAGRLDTAGASAADLAEGLGTLLESAPERPERIVAVSVVDRWTERLELAADELSLPLVVAGASNIPMATALLRPDRAGPDRLLAAWAASLRHGAPVIVVDLGTATTVDVVDPDGFFLGGAILPGLGLAAESLAEGTARLPHVELELPETAIGVDTAGAIQGGIVIGHLGAVRELVTRMRSRLGEAAAPGQGGGARGQGGGARSQGVGARARVVVTGGHASAAWARAAWTEPAEGGLPPIADAIDPQLVLRGLGLLATHLAARTGAGARA
jgi:type III pantothenate kinase